MIRKIFILVFLGCAIHSVAQEKLNPRPSPLAIASVRYKDTYLKITYSQPHKRGREVFGALVPYGQVWRLGANENTEVTITRDVILNSTILKAGTYSLFAIPEKDHWTIIVNGDVGQWGSYNYSIKLDIMRFSVPVQVLSDVVYEPFTIVIDQKNEKADVIMYWDKLKVSFPIRFTEPAKP